MHLPLQSGSDRILKAMNRGYTKEQYLQLVSRLKEMGITVTTDIIVGFPGETDEDFADTLDAVKKAKFAGAFTFMYSPREGTPAAKLTNEVPRETAKERFNQLVEIMNPLQAAHNRKYLGQVVEVMAEGESKNRSYTGRSDDNVLVHFDSERGIRPGDMVMVEILECKTFYIAGRER
jgi:tRNA-2-methylthio-N6-dimethylallyladenosine synthase